MTSQPEQQTENPWDRIFKTQASQNKFLPKNWHEKHFSNLEAKEGTQLFELIKILDSRELDDQVGVWLSGKTGHGKTHLLLALFNRLSWLMFSQRGFLNNQIKFYNYTDLCGIIRQDPNNYDLFCKLRSPEFLFIDDIGTSKTTDFIQEKIYSLFNYRCENNLPTFASTNMTSKQINEEFSERMGSRIQESAVWIELAQTKDYRSKIFQTNMDKYKHLRLLK